MPIERLHDIDSEVISKALKAQGARLVDCAAVNLFVADLRVAAATKHDPYSVHKSKKEEKSLFPYKAAEERALLRVAKIAARHSGIGMLFRVRSPSRLAMGRKDVSPARKHSAVLADGDRDPLHNHKSTHQQFRADHNIIKCV